MKALKLVIRMPGSLLSKLMDVEITQEQYAQVVTLLANPETYVVVPRDQVIGHRKEPMGFRREGA